MKYFYCCLYLLLAFANPKPLCAQNVLDLSGLNGSATTTVAYSVRKLSTSYSGLAITVRRSSDNSLQDIGFTVEGDLDISNLLTFAGSGDAYIATWYDQSGYAKNLTQTTAANQPRIVSGGNMDLENGKPFIRFFGVESADPLLVIYNSLQLPAEITSTGHLSVVNKFAVGGNGFILGHSSFYYWHGNSSAGQLVWSTGASSSFKNGKFWQNGISVAPNAAVFNTNLMTQSIVPQVAGTGTTWDNIGSDRNLYHVTSLGGGYAELIVFSSELDTVSRISLNENQGAYFAISKSLDKYGRITTVKTDFLNRNGATGNSGIIKSGESFVRSALAVPPVTASIYSITSYSALSGGTVSSDKGANLLAGVCWNTSAAPTTLNFTTTDAGKAGSYTSKVTGLRGNTLYYLRSYATNKFGTKYGNELSFTTTASVSPVFSGTAHIDSVTATTAVFTNEIVTDGGDPITQKGICWGTVSDPAIADTKTTISDSLIGTFSSKITGLTPATTYYARAYATNSVGTSYGSQLSFTTNATLITGDYYQGGVIGYIFVSGDPGYVAGEKHGLIVAENSLAVNVAWDVTIRISRTVTTSAGLGTGNSNTLNIITAVGNTSAAYACKSQTTGGYSDWYLPSKDELNKIYLNKNVLPNFSFPGTNYYWTSTSFASSSNNAYYQDFTSGSQSSESKTKSRKIRPVRSF